MKDVEPEAEGADMKIEPPREAGTSEREEAVRDGGSRGFGYGVSYIGT